VPGAAGVNSLWSTTKSANNIELGIKSNLFERRAQINASVFATIVRGYQSNAYDAATSTSYITNAGDVRSRGANWKRRFRWRVVFRCGANGAFNDVKYLKYTNAPCPPEIAATSCDLSGRTRWSTHRAGPVT
jgi:iron complex outermembrane receptor protein